MATSPPETKIELVTPSKAKVKASAPAAARGRRGAAARTPRPYLRSEDRRRQLLEVARQIAGSEGVDRLTIVGLAKAAGVSRQLVYDHFSDLQSLVGAVLAERFTVIDDAIYRSISTPGAFDGPEHGIETALQAARGFLELPREDRHLLRSVLSATDAPAHELNPLALLLRGRSIRRWRPLLGGDREPSSQARAWALANALDGLGDLVGTGELDAEEALAEFEFLLRATVAAGAAAPRPARRGSRKR